MFHASASLPIVKKKNFRCPIYGNSLGVNVWQDKKNLLHLSESKPRSFDSASRNVVNIPTELPWSQSKVFFFFADYMPGTSTKSLTPVVVMLARLAVQSNLGSRTPRITNSLICEQIFRTQSVQDDVLCLELGKRKPSTSWSDKLGVSVFHFLTTFHLRRQLSSIQVW